MSQDASSVSVSSQDDTTTSVIFTDSQEPLESKDSQEPEETGETKEAEEPQEEGTTASPSARLTDPQRFWILYYLGCARTKLDVKKEDVTCKVYRQLCKILDENKDTHKLNKHPSISSVKKLWFTVKKTGIVAGVRTGGRKKTPYREEVEFLLKTRPDLSYREISKLLAPELKISHGTVRRITMDLEKSAEYKRLIPPKPKAKRRKPARSKPRATASIKYEATA